jgi:hypothetical protein
MSRSLLGAAWAASCCATSATAAVGATAAADVELSAVDTTPPVISLDLSEAVSKTYSGLGSYGEYQAFGHNYTTRVHQYGQTAHGEKTCEQMANHPMCVQLEGQEHAVSKPDSYSKTCNVLVDTQVTCPEPRSTAFDQHDEWNVVVEPSYKLYVESMPAVNPVRVDLVKPAVGVNEQGVYDQRGEYLIKYDAQDLSGNHAESIMFSMVVGDQTPPQFDNALFQNFVARYHELESMHIIQHTAERALANHGSFPADHRRRFFRVPMMMVAVDTYDGVVTPTIGTHITSPHGVYSNLEGAYGGSLRHSGADIDTYVVGDWTVQFSAHDCANIFGVHGVNNTGWSDPITFEVRDTIPPVIYCKPAMLTDRRDGAFDMGDMKYAPVTVIGQPFQTVSIPSRSLEQCAGACLHNQWDRIVIDVPFCRGFQLVEEDCRLFNETAVVPTGNRFERIAHAHLEGHAMRQCLKDPVNGATSNWIEPITAEFACASNVYVTDPGALCVDGRDSYDFNDGGVDSTAMGFQTTYWNVTDPFPNSANSTNMSRVLIEGAVGVDRHFPGTYHVVYSCSDQQNNSATEATRVVIVKSMPAPEFKMKQDEYDSMVAIHPGLLLSRIGSSFECISVCGPCQGQGEVANVMVSNISFMTEDAAYLPPPDLTGDDGGDSFIDEVAPRGSEHLEITNSQNFVPGDVVKVAGGGNQSPEFKMVLNIIAPRGAENGQMVLNTPLIYDHFKHEAITHSTHNTSCVTCNPTQYSNGSMTCEYCPMGKWSGVAATTCVDYTPDPCPAGKYSDSNGACDSCENGSYDTWISVESCAELHCPQGTFQTAEAYFKCDEAPPVSPTETESPDGTCPVGTRYCHDIGGSQVCAKVEAMTDSFDVTGERCPAPCKEITRKANGLDEYGSENGLTITNTLQFFDTTPENQAMHWISTEPLVPAKMMAGIVYVYYKVALRRCLDGIYCHDNRGPQGEVVKRVVIIDDGHPVVSILGLRISKGLEYGTYNDYSRPGNVWPNNFHNYQDLGATCYDKVDGDLTSQITDAGSQEYMPCKPQAIKDYQCVDSEGHGAQPAIRSVFFPPPIPNCTMFPGPSAVEASFPYHDAGAICQVGMIPTPPEFWSNESQYSSAEVIVNVETTGDYVVTYRADNGCQEYEDEPLANAHFWNTHGEHERCGNIQCRHMRTVKVVDTLKPVMMMTDMVDGKQTLIQHTLPEGDEFSDLPQGEQSALQWHIHTDELTPVAVRMVSGSEQSKLDGSLAQNNMKVGTWAYQNHIDGLATQEAHEASVAAAAAAAAAENNIESETISLEPEGVSPDDGEESGSGLDPTGVTGARRLMGSLRASGHHRTYVHSGAVIVAMGMVVIGVAATKMYRARAADTTAPKAQTQKVILFWV